MAVTQCSSFGSFRIYIDTYFLVPLPPATNPYFLPLLIPLLHCFTPSGAQEAVFCFSAYPYASPRSRSFLLQFRRTNVSSQFYSPTEYVGLFRPPPPIIPSNVVPSPSFAVSTSPPHTHTHNHTLVSLLPVEPLGSSCTRGCALKHSS